MADPSKLNIRTIREDLRRGRYRAIAKNDALLASMRVLGAKGLANKALNVEAIRCASYYCEVLDQCGRYAEVRDFLDYAAVDADKLSRIRRRVELAVEATLQLKVNKQALATAEQRYGELRGVNRLILQVSISDLRRGRFDAAERNLRLVASGLRRIRSSAKNSEFPIHSLDPSFGLESLVHYWIGRIKLSTGKNAESVFAFQKAVRGTYDSLHWHRDLDTASQLRESLAYSQYQIASCLSFGFAQALELQGRLQDATALLWPAAVVFMGQSDEIRYGYTLMMLGGLARTTAGSSKAHYSKSHSRSTILDDLTTSREFLQDALRCFLGSRSEETHYLHAARAYHNLALTELRFAQISEVDKITHLDEAEAHENNSDHCLAKYPEEYLDPILLSGIQVARSRILLVRGDLTGAVIMTRRAREILRNAGVHHGIHYHRACFAEVDALIQNSRLLEAAETIAEVEESTERDNVGSAYLYLYEAELEWHRGRSDRSRSLHSQAAELIGTMENTWVKMKFEEITRLLPTSNDLALNIQELLQTSKRDGRRLWDVAQDELARLLITATEKDELGERRTQLKQADLLGIDRAYLSKVRKRLMFSAE